MAEPAHLYVIGDTDESAPDPPVTFTRRQRQVLALIAAGLSNREIASRLGISARTARAHSDILREKLGVSQRRRLPYAFRCATGIDPLDLSC